MLDIRRPRSPGVSPAGAEPGLNYSFSPTSHRSLVFAVQGVQYTALMPLLDYYSVHQGVQLDQL